MLLLELLLYVTEPEGCCPSSGACWASYCCCMLLLLHASWCCAMPAVP